MSKNVGAVYREKKSRSLWKALSWRVTGSLATAAIVFLFTGNAGGALAVGGVEFILKVFLFYVHERAWDYVSLGKFVAEQDTSANKVLQPFVIWFTGLPSSGKTTLSLKMKEFFETQGIRVEHLDGDEVRAIVPGTGFTRKDRNDHIRRMGFLSSRLEHQGVPVIASFVSPYRESRDFCRKICKNFLEIHLSTGIDECVRRDVKGLYQKAKEGNNQGMTGLDDPYEAPLSPELVLDTQGLTPEECVSKIQELLLTKALLAPTAAIPFRGNEDAKVELRRVNQG